jgi:hypothetical protein
VGRGDAVIALLHEVRSEDIEATISSAVTMAVA